MARGAEGGDRMVQESQTGTDAGGGALGAGMLAALRPRLLAFARLQLRSDSAAEDVVQDTLLAAVEGAATHAGGSSVSTWVFAILKHKIADEFRRARRHATESLPDEDQLEAVLDAFDDSGHWVQMPSAWADPQRSLEDARFWQVLDTCLTRLPPAPARVFLMRETMDMDTAAICSELGISTSNCWVLLHRARLALRECLGHNWFGGTAP